MQILKEIVPVPFRRNRECRQCRTDAHPPLPSPGTAEPCRVAPGDAVALGKFQRPDRGNEVCTRLTAGGRSLERTRLWSRVHASGDRLGQAGGRGYKRNGGSTPCVSYHHRRKYVRAAQDRWAPQAEEISPARRENRENRALGRDNVRVVPIGRPHDRQPRLFDFL